MKSKIRVMIWGKEVGLLSWDERRNCALFEYNRDFLAGNLDIAPLTASIKDDKSRFPFYGTPKDPIFCGIPPFISDSLPGRWGNTVFTEWAIAHNIRESEITPVEKLAFIGKRAMGALEFEPAEPIGSGLPIALENLYHKAQEIQGERESTVMMEEDLSLDALYEVGTSAGGAHTKAVIARNNKTGDIRSGQILLPPEYTYYLLKFIERDYYPLTLVEFVYSVMAKKAGVQMMPCELVEIDGERHFLTERYDRKDGKKIHTQSLAAMNPEAGGYGELMRICQQLSLPYKEHEEMFRRMVFNILTTNVDAHIKNFSFMMEEGKEWHITPAYDLTFSCFNPKNKFDTYHALSVLGKRTNIDRNDLMHFAKHYSIKNPAEIIGQCVEAVMQFRDIADETGVDEYWTDKIEEHFAEMNPELLSELDGFKAKTYSFYIKEKDLRIEDAVWQEMGNGAMRLTAKVNGRARRLTFAAKSSKTAEIKSKGGCKMSPDNMRKYVLEFFV